MQGSKVKFDTKDSEKMISYLFFSHFEAVGLIIREIQGCFSMPNPLDLEGEVKGFHISKLWNE